MWFLLSLAAQADEPNEEMIIEAERLVIESRAALDSSIDHRGYLRAVFLGSRAIYLHPQVWKPWISVYDSGWATVKGRRVTPMVLLPVGKILIGGGVFGSRRTVQNMEASIWHAIEPELVVWQEAVRRQDQLFRSEEIRQSVWAIWASDQPPPTRRGALVEMWLNTTDTDAGADVRAMIAVFIDDVVQVSPHPLTDEEVSRANDHRPVLSEPLEPVPSSL
ncbi:MAG: hypothetical protein ACI8RZ_002111 [Myxococcota bacterium]|jgi:hypothetical protein